MVYCVLMILYLNTRDVRMVFQRRKRHGVPREN
jgi:hypothetical protein